MLRWKAEIRADADSELLAAFDGYSRDVAFGMACQSELFRSLDRCVVVMLDRTGVTPPEPIEIGPIKDRYTAWE